MAQLITYDEYGFDRDLFDGAAIAFGVFDGYHEGHRFLVESAIGMARRAGERSVALTFDRDPDELFRPASLRKIMPNEQRLETLARSGVDLVVVLPFTNEFAALEPEAFLRRTFGLSTPSSLHVGCDFRFGAKAQGTVDVLRFWAERTGTEVVSYSLEERDGEPITSTRIRALLGSCHIKEANELLGRPFSVASDVIPGRQEGRAMGFATANLLIPPMLQTLGEGVYGAYGLVDGVRYKAAVSVGVSPTFERVTANSEVHLLDFEGDLYGDTLVVEFVEHLRPMKKFDRVEDLIATITADIQWCRDNL